MKLARSKLEQLMEDLVKRTIEPCKKALADAGKKASDIDEVWEWSPGVHCAGPPPPS